jgi:glycine cleavage system aminomethyltransferase T
MIQENNYNDLYMATRNGIVFQVEDDLHCLKIDGPDAQKVLDTICPCDVFLQDGQIKQTLLLTDEGIPFADIYIGREGESYYILGNWPESGNLIEWINANVPENLNFEILNLDENFKRITIEGPYSWELTAQIINSDVMGLPYLGVMQIGNIYIFRAGITGEYGYHLIIPSDDFLSFKNELLSLGEKFELKESIEDVKSQCVLESFFFDIKNEGKYNLNPMELQMQWRLSRQKEEYPGSEAIKEIKDKGWDQRVICFSCNEQVKKDKKVSFEGEEIGKILNVGFSPLRNDFVGKALIKKPYWHAGVPYYKVDHHFIQTISAPAVLFKSLSINPYKQSFFTQNDDDEI